MLFKLNERTIRTEIKGFSDGQLIYELFLIRSILNFDCPFADGSFLEDFFFDLEEMYFKEMFRRFVDKLDASTSPPCPLGTVAQESPVGFQ